MALCLGDVHVVTVTEWLVLLGDLLQSMSRRELEYGYGLECSFMCHQ